MRMVPSLWIGSDRKLLVCVDDYCDGVLKGRAYDACKDMCEFESLSQFLIKIESFLEHKQRPQAYTSKRSFTSLVYAHEETSAPSQFRKGAKATFEMQVLFRQYSSWQGVLIWKERDAEQSFRSVLELIFLLDSALREQEGSVAS